jgi:hypothetical protein
LQVCFVTSQLLQSKRKILGLFLPDLRSCLQGGSPLIASAQRAHTVAEIVLSAVVEQSLLDAKYTVILIFPHQVLQSSILFLGRLPIPPVFRNHGVVLARQTSFCEERPQSPRIESFLAIYPA